MPSCNTHLRGSLLNASRITPHHCAGRCSTGAMLCLANGASGSLDNDAGGSLSVNLKTGLWLDRATGERGDALDLVKAVQGLDTVGAIEWAAAWLSDPALAVVRREAADRPAQGDDNSREWFEATARKVWRETLEPRGTIVEAYRTRPWAAARR